LAFRGDVNVVDEFARAAFGITFAVFAYWLFPVNSLAAPEWDVTCS